jgi:saccharopine dehydrogenase-like NADP-dependent oxidoreductase
MKNKKKVVVFGAGKIGRLVCIYLGQTNDYEITLVDENRSYLDNVKKLKASQHTKYVVANFTDIKELQIILKDKDYALSCAPFYCNEKIAQVCRKLEVHYLDLTEDVKTTKIIKKLSHNAKSAFIPQCGLAPGFITIATHHLVKKFDEVEDVKMRVGALPLFPHNRLKYNLTWNTEGLINEYCNDCEAVVNGKFEIVKALEGEERFDIEGEEYEAFNTSGGLGTLAETLHKDVKHMNYKSIRYPGHRDIIYTLLHDLKFIDDRAALRYIFERSLPHTVQDLVIIFITVTGKMDGVYCQENYSQKIKHAIVHDKEWGAIQITTASGICAVLDLHAKGLLPKKGFIKQEDIDFKIFISNRFGRVYS